MIFRETFRGEAQDPQLRTSCPLCTGWSMPSSEGDDVSMVRTGSKGAASGDWEAPWLLSPSPNMGYVEGGEEQDHG